MQGARASKPLRFDLLVIALGIAAFALREYYLLVARVDWLLDGDAREYWAYAWNLVSQGVFSGTTPPRIAVPDAQRLPGYPWLIAGAMRFAQEGWYPIVLFVQALLGAMTAVFVALLARHWVGAWWSILAGLLIAVWPHHVAATNALLPEVLLGFLLAGGLLAFARAWTTGRTAWHAVAGATFGYAWLVDPVLLFFPPLLACLAWRHGQGRHLALLLAVFLVPVLGMSLRNAIVDAGSSAVHATHESVEERRSEDSYAARPWLSWGWRIQDGASDISFHHVREQPFDRNPVLHGVLVGLRALNPLLTSVMLAASIVLVVAALRRARWIPAAAVGALALYVTLADVVLQAGPRAAIAWRGLEVVLLVTAFAWSVRWLQTRWAGSSGASTAARD